MSTAPVRWTPFVGEATATHGRTPLTTWIWATPVTAPTDATTVPFAGGGLAVKLTFGPVVTFSEPTPPVTAHEYAKAAIGLSHASYPWAERSRPSKGRIVTSFGVTERWSRGPGETATSPLSPEALPKLARIRIVSAFVYVSVLRVVDPPAVIAIVVVPRVPPPGVTPSGSRASIATVPVHQVIVAFPASLAVIVTVNDAPAVAVDEAVTKKRSSRWRYPSRISLIVGVTVAVETDRRDAGGETLVQLPPESVE